MPDPTESVDIPLSLFSGLNTELAPTDLPEGVSPDNNDVQYLPGSVFSRWGLHKALAASLGDVGILYQKSFLQTDGTTKTIILDSAGNFWQENVTTGTVTKFATTTAGTRVKTVTAFGREYCAVNNLLNGTEPPFQFDGINLDVVTQSGPGSTVTVSSLSTAAQNLATSGPGSHTATITTATASNPHQVWDGDSYTTVYTSATYNTSGAHTFNTGDLVTISGVSDDALNLGAVNINVTSPTQFKVFNQYFTNLETGTGGTAVSVTTTILSRTNNFVTGNTATAHGLLPGSQVIINGVANTSLGGGIASVARLSNVTTVVTNAAHNLFAGSVVLISGVTDPTYDSTAGVTVVNIISSTSFTYDNSGADGSSSSGTVGDIWNGQFLVTAVPSATQFVYQQIGANDTATGSGTETPWGQIVAGQHSVVCMFLTRTGYITKPSPATTFYANGGQKIVVGNIPIGTPNVVARILAFTGSNGGAYFYIATPPVFNGFVVGSSTVVNDNISTTATFDFSDNTLFTGISIDTAGNNLFESVTLGPCLSVFSYASRVMWFGRLNKIENFLNMDFHGGTVNSVLTGWDVSLNAGGQLASGTGYLNSISWQITGDGTAGPKGELQQGAFQDSFSVAILAPNTKYGVNCWLYKDTGDANGSLVFRLHSPSVGLLATATLPFSSIGYIGMYSFPFDVATPAVIPADTVVQFYTTNGVNGQNLFIGNTNIYFTETPYRVNEALCSYADTPEIYDGVTGIMGPSDDPTALLCAAQIRSNLYLYSIGGVHQTQDNAGYEPSEWTINEVSRTVGAISIYSADAGMFGTGDTGEEWNMLIARGGLYIYAGNELYKISQENNKFWETINWNYAQTAWVKNDTVNRRAYVGLPIGNNTSPNVIVPIDYRELESPLQITSSGPLRISFTGKMIASDLARKWTVWTLAMNYGEILTRPGNTIQFCVGAGSTYGNFYYFDPNKLTDDDYGIIGAGSRYGVPTYTTYFFVNHELEQQLGFGGHRKLWTYIAAFVSGVGQIRFVPLVDSLTNAWPATPWYTMTTDPTFDYEWNLRNTGERSAYRLEIQPLQGMTDLQFSLNKLIVTMKKEPIAPLRGSL